MLGDARGPIPLPNGGFVTVGHLDLPAGSYVVTASLFTTNSGSGTALAYCILLIGGQNAQAIDTLAPSSGGVGAAVSQALTVAGSQPTPGAADLRCTNNALGTLEVQTYSLNAIKVGTLAIQP